LLTQFPQCGFNYNQQIISASPAFKEKCVNSNFDLNQSKGRKPNVS
jgi:hypothetical protein